MCHAGGEQAERGQLLVPFGQSLAFHQFDAQRHDHVPVNHRRQRDAKQEQQAEQAQNRPAELNERLMRMSQKLGS